MLKIYKFRCKECKEIVLGIEHENEVTCQKCDPRFVVSKEQTQKILDACNEKYHFNKDGTCTLKNPELYPIEAESEKIEQQQKQ